MIKNTAVKITHRLPAQDDRAAVGATMNLRDAQSQYLVTLVPGEAEEEPQFLAPPYRWTLVRAALRTATPGERRHPRSGEWEHAYGEPVPGATAGQQLRVINRRYTRDQRDTRAVTAVIWGSRPRPAIERAVGARAGSGDWPGRLADALTAFARLPWPPSLLVRPGAAPGREAAGKPAAGE